MEEKSGLWHSRVAGLGVLAMRDRRSRIEVCGWLLLMVRGDGDIYPILFIFF